MISTNLYVNWGMSVDTIEQRAQGLPVEARSELIDADVGSIASINASRVGDWAGVTCIENAVSELRYKKWTAICDLAEDTAPGRKSGRGDRCIR